MENIEQYINKKRMVQLLTTLVEIPSPYFEEKGIMDFVYHWLLSNELPAEYHLYHEEKITDFQGVNVLGRLKGNRSGPKILLNGHLDTVQICEGWNRDPLVAQVEGNRLYGLGALDMKSGAAAILLAVDAFQKLVKDFSGEVIYTFVSDEEGPFGLGTDALIVDEKVIDADVAIVPEPSSGFCKVPFPCLCLGARGGWNYTVEVKGKSAHAANPEQGINAVIEAAKIILELEKAPLRMDEKLGKGSICILGMQGGGAVCSVADRASFTVFRHVVRGEDQEYVKKEFAEAVQRANIQGTVKMSFRDSPHEKNGGFDPYIVSLENPYTKNILESIYKTTGIAGNVQYFSSIGDFNYLATRLSIPTFVFGPSGENYHGPDEYVNIDSAVATSKVILNFLLQVLTDY